MTTNPFLAVYATDQSDTELIKQAREGQRSALEALLRKHQPYIYNIAWRMVHNPDDAADLTQEVLIKITTLLGQFDQKSSFRTWAYRIVVNHFLKMKRRGGEHLVSHFEDMAERLDDLTDQPLTELEQQEQAQLIRELNLRCMAAMLLCLTREQRLAYIIGELFGGNHTIGAALLHISKDNFRAKLSKARRDLYQFMNRRCGLVNKANPCRCHKKITVAVAKGNINAKELLHNQQDFSSFERELAPDADFLSADAEAKYRQLHRGMTYQQDFDHKLFIEEVLADADWQRRLNLN